MKKIIINLSIVFAIIAIFFICISKTSALSCAKKYGYVLKNGRCFNSKTLISYNSDARKNFYYKNMQCGFDCDYNGKNCNQGACFSSECPKAFPQLKTVFDEYHGIYVWSCYNPQTHMGYYPDNYHPNQTNYYLNDKKCGENCNSDGTNCKVGFCNYKECAKGYTQIKSKRCYNPTTGISYGISFKENYKTHTVHEEFDFYLADEQCGKNCNLDGSNCDDGKICILSYCNKQAGYTKIRNGLCYNEKTGFSYDSKHDLYKETDKYKNKSYCGTNCDINTGKHCQKGVCDISDCAKGYSQFKVIDATWQCYNPTSKLSYCIAPFYNYARESYNNGYKCGINCDFDGRHCQKGICNLLDCAKGYTKFASGECVNPQTKLSYKLSYNGNTTDFSYNDVHCGYGCNYDGQNCKEGNCSPDKLAQKSTKSQNAKNSNLTEAAGWIAFAGAVGIGGAVAAPFYYTAKGISKFKQDKPIEQMTKAQKNTPKGYTMILLEKNHKK